MKNIEVEFRAKVTEAEYKKLYRFLLKNAKDLGNDDKDTYFFIFSDKALKVVNNISQKSAKIVLKLNKIGFSNSFKETEIGINQKDVKNMALIFDALGHKEVIHAFQKRHNFLYQGVEIALKYSDDFEHHLEMEVMIDGQDKQTVAEKKIFAVAEELGVHLLSDEELQKIVYEIEEKHRKVAVTLK